MGFDHFLDRTAADPGTATFYGLAMPPPTAPGLRLVQIVGPVPVFAWYAMWRRQPTDERVTRFLSHVDSGDTGVAVADALDPDRVWLPAADRRELASG